MKKFSILFFSMFFLSSSVMAASGDLCGKIGGKCLSILSKDKMEYEILGFKNKESWEQDFSRCIQEYKNLECSMDKLKDVYELAEMIEVVDWKIMLKINKVHGKSFEVKDISEVMYWNYLDNVHNLDAFDIYLATERCKNDKNNVTFNGELCDIFNNKTVNDEDILYKIKRIEMKKKELIMSKQY